MNDIFRIKKARDIPFSKKITTGTLDSVHQSIVSSLQYEENNPDKLKERLYEIDQEINTLSNSLENILTFSKLSDEKKILLEKLEMKSPVIDYYVKNADIMLKYYGSGEKISGGISNADQKTFVKFLCQNTSENIGTSKKTLFDEFSSRMKINTGPIDVKEAPSEHCNACNLPREESSEEGVLFCPSCGSEEYMLVVSDVPSFRDPPKERNNYAYKKINHLNEILNQFQGKESTIIPVEVMNEVICEIKKRRIQNVAELGEKEIREILKKIGRSKYYEHGTHIISRLNGNPPPTITPEIEEKIRTMFQEIQAPFLIYCPDDRTNFLSYSYILYKFFELLELDEYKIYFPLLKSRDRLISHDEIWQKICDYLKWEFIRSV
jgi:uncharacterized Zn finger protein (UPF0148 family)